MIVISNERQLMLKRYIARISSQSTELFEDADVFAGLKTGDSFMIAYEAILDQNLRALIREVEKPAKRIEKSRHTFGVK